MPMISFEDFKSNCDQVYVDIEAACLAAGRSPKEIKLMAVTKYQPARAIDYAAQKGLFAIGENRVQDALTKLENLASPIRCELIGHLQSNKAKQAVALFDRIQTVDSTKILDAIEKYAKAHGKEQAVLLQVNTAMDPAKYGISAEEAPSLLEYALSLAHVKVEGLMTIPALDVGEKQTHSSFEKLRILRDRLANDFSTALPELSMGMSADLKLAIAAGSTLVRIGTRLFKSP